MDRSRRGAERFGGTLAWYVLVALVVAGLVLLALNRGGAWRGVSSAPLDDVIAPAQRVANSPLDLARGGVRGLSRHWRVHAENRRLREENARLRRWYDLSLAMRDKMERYEALLALNPDPAADAVTARVVQELRGPFVHGRLINAGVRDGVAAGQAALADRGLVGRVVTVGRVSARILLLTDVNSRVPVMADRNDARAILAGDNGPRPRLEFRRASHGLREGDRIVTSGDAGRLPRGLPVGVAYIDQQGAWRVRLFADDAPLDYVRVIRFLGAGGAVPAPDAIDPAAQEDPLEDAPSPDAEQDAEPDGRERQAAALAVTPGR